MNNINLDVAAAAARNAYFGPGRHGPIEFGSLTPESQARWRRVVEAADRAHFTEADVVGSFAIEVEKMLLAKLGRPWTPGGISIVSLINELANKDKQCTP